MEYRQEMDSYKQITRLDSNWKDLVQKDPVFLTLSCFKPLDNFVFGLGGLDQLSNKPKASLIIIILIGFVSK